MKKRQRSTADFGIAALSRKLGAEFIGTFFVTLTAASVDILYYTGNHVDFVSRWLARGFITTVLIYALSEISGAHVDPVVSFAFALRKAMPPGLALLYCVAQFAGGFAAAGLTQALWHSQAAYGASHPGPHFSHLTAALAEIILTFLVVGVILTTAEEEAKVGEQAALAVGLSVAACGFFGGSISGASMNPARSIPAQILGGLDNIIWIYVAGPVIGATLAALCMYFLRPQTSEGENKAATGRDR